MKMKYFTLEGFEGFDEDQISKFNDQFEDFAHTKGFDLSDEQEFGWAFDKFWNEVMIYG